MKGLELSRRYYEAFGKEMLFRDFPDYVERIAVGLAGEGSECFGYDDDVSWDHDFGPSFCMWLTEEDYLAVGESLQKAYGALPKSFLGIGARIETSFGAGRRGVKTIAEFYRNFTGRAAGPESWRDWMQVPDHFFATAVNGEVFCDHLGEFSRIRNHIKTGMPEDVRKKKIAARAVKMAQSGQYNFKRCLRHGEPGAACLALAEFVRETIQMAFLLGRVFCPFYKWMFRAMRGLEALSDLHRPLEELLTNGGMDNSGKETRIEQISTRVIRELKDQGLSDGDWDYLEPHAYRIMEGIQNREIQKLHVMQG